MNEKFSVVVEGGDQVGKGDAVCNLSRELSNEGYDVCVVSFPCYATPIGNAVREVLTKDTFLKLGFDPDEEMSCKMALFALNRLEVLNTILQSGENTLYICDRGPFSNALTIAYGIVQGRVDASKIDSFVDEALLLDSFFRKSMNSDDCVIKLSNTNRKWSGVREDADLHERTDVQELSEGIYEVFSERLSSGWADIVTRDSNGWKSRDDILSATSNFVKSKIKLASTETAKIPIYLSPSDMLSDLYLGSVLPSDSLDLFTTALKVNDKIGMYDSSGIIASSVVHSFEEIKWYNEEIRGAVREILEKNPGINIVLEDLYGEGFVIKLLRSIYD